MYINKEKYFEFREFLSTLDYVTWCGPGSGIWNGVYDEEGKKIFTIACSTGYNKSNDASICLTFILNEDSIAKLSVEEFLEKMPAHIQEDFLFHLDIFS